MMQVIMKPIFGIDKGSVGRAREEIGRVLECRGRVITAKADGLNVIVTFEINPLWGPLPEGKAKYLKKCMPAEVRRTFRVLSVSEDHN
jgi:hypothetical protein